jgi:SAM-dependent methyltransferase
VRASLLELLVCPLCGGRLRVQATSAAPGSNGRLLCASGHAAPLIDGIPRLLPASTAASLVNEHRDYFDEFPDLRPTDSSGSADSVRTQNAFGDEWHRFPEIHDVHQRIFDWYFEGPEPVEWRGLRALDAGCGMGRWLHFARKAGAEVVGMDVSAAIEVAARRDGAGADFVQADLRLPPFAPASFDLVYSLGVVHHLEDPLEGVRALAKLVRPGGELRIYVYRILEEETLPRRLLVGAVTLLRRITTRIPYPAVHAVSWTIAGVATVLFLWPRRMLRTSALGDRLTRGLPLVQYADVPFRMLVAEQFDRLVAPIEGRFRKEEVEAWLRDAGLQTVAILSGLGWRAIARRPPEGATS